MCWKTTITVYISEKHACPDHQPQDKREFSDSDMLDRGVTHVKTCPIHSDPLRIEAFLHASAWFTAP